MTHDEQSILLVDHVEKRACCSRGMPAPGMLRYQYDCMGAHRNDETLDPQDAILALAPDAHGFVCHIMIDGTKYWLFDASPIATLPSHITLHLDHVKRRDMRTVTTVIIAGVEMCADTDNGPAIEAAIRALKDAGEESAPVYIGSGAGAVFGNRRLHVDGSIRFPPGGRTWSDD